MRFDPRSEEQIAARKVWPKGIYEFRVIETEEKLSAKRGNPMVVLTLEIKRKDGETRIIKDYLLPQRPEKLLHAATTCGVREKYYAGVISEDDFIDKRGRLELGIQTSKDWPTKNIVRDYV